MADMAQDERAVKKVVVVGGGLVRFSVKVLGRNQFVFLITLSCLHERSYSKFFELRFARFDYT